MSSAPGFGPGAAHRYGMDWHVFVTHRGAEAAALVAIGALVAALWRWGMRVRTKTREAFARSIGTHVAEAMTPLANKVDAIDKRVNAHIAEQARRRELDDSRWEQTEKLYARFHAHMDAEDKRG